MMTEYTENHTKSRFSHQKYRLWPMPNSLRSSGRVLKTAPELASLIAQLSAQVNDLKAEVKDLKKDE